MRVSKTVYTYLCLSSAHGQLGGAAADAAAAVPPRRSRPRREALRGRRVRRQHAQGRQLWETLLRKKSESDIDVEELGN